MRNLTLSGIKWGLLGAAFLTTGVFAQQARITATAGGQAAVLDLSGFQVTDASNQRVGKVEHLVISPSGCVDAAVLSMEGNRLIAVPWQLVTVEKTSRAIGGGTSTLHVNVDRAKLQAAPVVTREQLVNISQNTQIYQHFGVQAPSGVGGTGAGTTQQQGTTTPGSTPSTTSPDSSTKGTTPQGSSSSSSSTIQGSSTSPSSTPGSQGTTSPGSSTTSGSSTNKASGSDFQTPGSDTRPPANRPPENRPPQNRPPENRPPSSTPSTP